MYESKNDELLLRVYDTREEMGRAAASDIAACFVRLLSEKESINVIFAAAPSQNETLAALKDHAEIPWERIRAFHMDEYVGISKEEPAGFANFLKRALFEQVPFRSVDYLDCTGDAETECARYSDVLRKNPPDVVVMGIGENGHIAFNDPHVAFFRDPVLVKEVMLDEVCRMQQVHDGCFPDLGSVPKSAMTLTIPALMAAPFHFCVVPGKAKAQACEKAFLGPVEEKCPASILRTSKNSILYCDADSAAWILK